MDIQAAIDALSPQGGTVRVPAGEFILRGLRWKRNVTLQGEGMDATRLVFVGEEPEQSVYCNMTGAWYGGMRDLRVSVDAATNTKAAGLVFLRDAWNCELSRVIIDCNGKNLIGMYIDGERETPVRKLQCRSVKITGSFGAAALYMKGEGTCNNFVDVATLSGHNGIVLDGQQQYMNTFNQCEIENNTGIGVDFRGSTKNKFSQCYFERNLGSHKHGLYWGDGNTFRDCIFMDS